MARRCGGRLQVPSTARVEAAAGSRRQRRRQQIRAQAAKVELVDLEGSTHVLEIPEDQTVLEVALEKGIDIPYDCKMGVCLRCSAKVVSGTLDQPGGMISEDCQAQGYALMCVAYPQSDCSIKVIPEEELVDAVMNI